MIDDKKNYGIIFECVNIKPTVLGKSKIEGRVEEYVNSYCKRK